MLRHDVAVDADAAFVDGVANLGHVNVRAGDRDARPDVVAEREVVAERLADEMPPGIERDDLARVGSTADVGRCDRRARCR